MKTRTFGLTLLLLAPIATAYLAGQGEAAKFVGIGAVLAVLLGLLARPVAASAVLLPAVYAAAALTVQSTDGVVALIVAIAAAVGAAGRGSDPGPWPCSVRHCSGRSSPPRRATCCAVRG